MRRALRTAWIVFRKELVDSLRDRRTLATVLVSSIALGPLALLLMANYISGIEAKSAARIIVVDGLTRAPQLASYFARNAITPKPAPVGYAEQIKSGALQDAVIVIPDDFAERYARAETIGVQLIFDDSRSGAQAAVRLAESALKSFARETAILRTLERGVDPQLLGAINVERINLATPTQQAAFLLFLIPMFGLIGAVIGSMSVAIDTTAGERERGSLEPLLMNPIALAALVVGKWAMVALFASGVVVLTFTGFAVATHFVPTENLTALFQFGVPELIAFAAVAIPFAWTISALLMLVATYGRSYKEAQTYASYIALVVNFVPLVTIFATLKDAPWQLFVPALAQQMVMSRILRGDAMSAADFGVPLTVAVVATALCLTLLVRLLRSERIVFGR